MRASAPEICPIPASSTVSDRALSFDQLITDLGPHSESGGQLATASAGDAHRPTRPPATTSLLQVNRAYFDVLHAQAVVKVAQGNRRCAAAAERSGDANSPRTICKSQLDVSFAEVNVSEAKLLLLRAQDSVQEAFAELARSMGSDQLANYQLVDEALPSGPPAAPTI